MNQLPRQTRDGLREQREKEERSASSKGVLFVFAPFFRAVFSTPMEIQLNGATTGELSDVRTEEKSQRLFCRGCAGRDENRSFAKTGSGQITGNSN